MQHQSIQHVVCLLPEAQLSYYTEPLLQRYQQAFGSGHVCWLPITDFSLIDPYRLVNVLIPFLSHVDQSQQRVVIHCSGGIGRTGHSLAAWLVAKYGSTNQEAIAAVRSMGRNPCEAGDPQLDTLLDTCRQLFVR